MDSGLQVSRRLEVNTAEPERIFEMAEDNAPLAKVWLPTLILHWYVGSTDEIRFRYGVLM